MTNLLAELAASADFIILQSQLNGPYLIKIVCLYWGSYLLCALLPGLRLLGIIPRQLYGLPGIFFAPFLHANFNHLFFNSIPLIVLSNFLLLYGFDFYLGLSLKITLLSGSLIWLFAKPGIHLGASALITGYWAFLVSKIFLVGGATSIILGLISLYYFFGIFLGIFPKQRGVSWEGHLFGLLAGLFFSYY